MKNTAELLKDLDEYQEVLLSCQTPAGIDGQRKYLEQLINELIQHDFQLLVHWLYRIDVDEKKIKSSLEKHRDEYAAAILADLIIERQQQKIESRKNYRLPQDIPEEDRW